MTAQRDRKWSTYISSQLNFFRLHLLLFILVPLFFSLIFYWLNDARTDSQPFVSFVDSLFLCISSATVAGLYTVVLSNLQVGQQVILAFLTAIGSYSFVSTAMVIIRRYYFSREMRRTLEKQRERMARARKETVAVANGLPLHEKVSPSSKSVQLPTQENDGIDVQPAQSSQTHSPVFYPSTLSERSNHSAHFVEEPQVYTTQLSPMNREPSLRRRVVDVHGRMVGRPDLRLNRTNTQATHMDRGQHFDDPLNILCSRYGKVMEDSLRSQQLPEASLPDCLEKELNSIAL